jgi:RHH-type proline utilization regulon transcriptional repressor/proline dehydrogenase/delta 1-pyrroline-5-carboxylate dehydrogenase
MPTQLGDNPCSYTPGVKWNTTAGSFTHMTELFGPVLGVMSFKNLPEAVRKVNATGFGLTSGLESLDDREQKIWRESVKAGNLYINRPTTGAIVLRQPFGGMGKSAFGPGAKAGGPNYVGTLMAFEPRSLEATPVETGRLPEMASLRTFWDRLDRSSRLLLELPVSSDGLGTTSSHIAQLRSAMLSFDSFARDELNLEQDHLKLIGQDNVIRYLPATPLRIRVTEKDHPFDICLRALAANAAKCRAIVSYPDGVHEATIAVLEKLTSEWAGRIEFLEETDEELIQAIKAGQVARLRFADSGSVAEAILRSANSHQVYVSDQPVSVVGRIELLRYVMEQSISFDYHRYGNLGPRSIEKRSEVL